MGDGGGVGELQNAPSTSVYTRHQAGCKQPRLSSEEDCSPSAPCLETQHSAHTWPRPRPLSGGSYRGQLSLSISGT